MPVVLKMVSYKGSVGHGGMLAMPFWSRLTTAMDSLSVFGVVFSNVSLYVLLLSASRMCSTQQWSGGAD
jgi:hypothetical protein